MNMSHKEFRRIRTWGKRSLFARNLLMVCLLVAVPLCGIIAISAFSTNSVQQKEMQQTCSDVAKDVAMKWNRIQDEYDQILSFISYDQEVELFFYDKEQKKEFYSQSSLKKMVQIPVLVNQYATNAYIFSDQIDWMITINGISQRRYSIDAQILENASKMVQQNDRVSNISDGVGSQYLLFHDDFVIGEITGIFLLKCGITPLLEYINFLPDGDFFITNDTHVLLSNRREVIGLNCSFFEEYGQDYVRASVTLDQPQGITATVFLRRAALQTGEILEERTLFLFAVVLICVTLTLAIWISNKLYSPFREILGVLGENSELTDRNSFGKRDELEYIVDAINQKRYFNEDAGREMAKRLELLKKAQAVALQAQINPHFINNTLETISFIAISQLGRENEVSRMVKALANMLSSTLDSVETLVSVKDEIYHCEQYLSIQYLRYRGKFETCWDVAPEVLNCKIIRITLQPLVENAIYHGIKHLSKPGRLDINIRREEEYLIVTVRDNGLGMTSEKLKEVTHQMQADMIQQSSHIGLANVYQRLKLFYGEVCALTIHSNLGEGTEITLKVPLK